MNVFERYAQIGKIKTPAGELPVLEVPQMSDERWQELTRENAVRNYTRENGRKPESVEQALAWQQDEWDKDQQREPEDNRNRYLPVSSEEN